MAEGSAGLCRTNGRTILRGIDVHVAHRPHLANARDIHIGIAIGLKLKAGVTFRPVQRWRMHKQRNVVEHLRLAKRRRAIWRLRAAWVKSDWKEAEKELKAVVQWLEDISPGAARSPEEGMGEILTLQKLGINAKLLPSLFSTHLIESCFSRAANWTRRIKHRRGASMILRWSAAAVLHAE